MTSDEINTYNAKVVRDLRELTCKFYDKSWDVGECVDGEHCICEFAKILGDP